MSGVVESKGAGPRRGGRSALEHLSAGGGRECSAGGKHVVICALGIIPRGAICVLARFIRKVQADGTPSPDYLAPP